jgi:hypothetical protein
VAVKKVLRTRRQGPVTHTRASEERGIKSVGLGEERPRVRFFFHFFSFLFSLFLLTLVTLITFPFLPPHQYSHRRRVGERTLRAWVRAFTWRRACAPIDRSRRQPAIP